MRDTKLYKQILEYCNDSINLIAKIVIDANPSLPTRVSEDFIVVDAHTVSQKQSVKVDWSRLIINKENELEKLSSYQKSVKALEAHKVIGPQMNTLVGTASAMRRMDASELLRIILTSLLMEKDDATLDKGFFDRLYENVENFLYTDIFHYKYFAPISNFSMDVDEISLGENLKIVKITKEDKEKLLSTSNTFNSTYPILAFKECAFEFLLDQKKVVGESTSLPTVQLMPEGIARTSFDKVCAALRLYKEGLIGINQIWATNLDWDFFGNSFSFTHKGPAEFYGSKMTLSAQEVPEFLELLKKYEDVSDKDRKKVINAVARLSFGTERMRPEDQIIDYFIGLEGLFLSDNNPELKYRLALSVAHWLGVNLEERKKIYQIVSKGYDQRSNIVHGGGAKPTLNIDGQTTSIADHTKLIENYLRQTTKKFIVECSDQNKSEEQLLIDLRDKILE